MRVPLRAFPRRGLHDPSVQKIRVAILGSTGSIGTQALDILRRNRDRFVVAALQAHRSEETVYAQAAEFGVADVCLSGLAEPTLPLPQGSRFHGGADGVVQMLERADPDVVLNGITGAAGLAASEWTLRAGKRLALANKESLVLAGELLMDLAARNGAEILPVDSEHCAIHQCLRSGTRSEVRRIHLTGSGGPFRQRPLDTFASITPKEALHHPTWTMGPRITVGSATMMNKAFEVLEAHWLFGLRPDQIQVVLHPQSIVHSMVEFCDGSIVAQCGLPDMRLPILYCLAYPERLEFPFQPFDATRWSKLEFAPFDPLRYPAIGLAYDVMRLGGDSGAVLNAADEVLTQRFLDGRLPFPSISSHASAILRARTPRATKTLGDVIAADREGRERAAALADLDRRDDPLGNAS
jgi:1-deoxy-D-xylulose-5-phosphate reductoisomerase